MGKTSPVMQEAVIQISDMKKVLCWQPRQMPSAGSLLALVCPVSHNATG